MIYARKWPQYRDWWDAMIINSSRVQEATKAAQYAIAHKDIYTEIEVKSGVPWVLIACNHRRESDSQDKDGNPEFNSYLGNGQPLWIKTTIVPIGRGPFVRKGAGYQEFVTAFIAGALDALHIDRLDQVRDWNVEKMLYNEEVFNGPGYDMRGMPAPYLWGGTTIQQPGKFVADHKFDKRVMDKQLGCAAIMKVIAQLDDTVKYARES